MDFLSNFGISSPPAQT